MPRSIARGLRQRGVDVLTTQEDGTETLADELLLERASSYRRILVSQDRAMAVITARWLREGRSFAGVIRAIEPRRQNGRMIEEIALVAGVYEPDEMVDRVLYVPL
jgi:predicted nuclease of predicted toxin-antitoxin system